MSTDTENLRLKALRKHLRFSQLEFSRYLGCDQTYISAIERGQRGISAQLAKGIQAKFGVSLDWLLKGVGQMIVNDPTDARFDARFDARINQSMQKHAPTDAHMDAHMKQSMQKTEVQEEAAAYGERAGPPGPTQAALEGRMAALEAQQVRLQASIDTLTQLLAAYLRHEGKV
jgi:transcriptional regulator with XRE-family HTH domain